MKLCNYAFFHCEHGKSDIWNAKNDACFFIYVYHTVNVSLLILVKYCCFLAMILFDAWHSCWNPALADCVCFLFPVVLRMMHGALHLLNKYCWSPSWWLRSAATHVVPALGLQAFWLNLGCHMPLFLGVTISHNHKTRTEPILLLKDIFRKKKPNKQNQNNKNKNLLWINSLLLLTLYFI